MRDIVFKGKRIDNGEWIEGWYVPALDEGRHCIFLASAPDMGEYVDPQTVCQYTALLDKTGTKVFEGDILSFRRGRAHEVKYAGGSFYMEGTSVPIRYAYKLEVIGNRWDNPELLEEKA